MSKKKFRKFRISRQPQVLEQTKHMKSASMVDQANELQFGKFKLEIVNHDI
jgi:hypothetical protein